MAIQPYRREYFGIGGGSQPSTASRRVARPRALPDRRRVRLPGSIVLARRAAGALDRCPRQAKRNRRGQQRSVGSSLCRTIKYNCGPGAYLRCPAVVYEWRRCAADVNHRIRIRGGGLGLENENCPFRVTPDAPACRRSRTIGTAHLRECCDSFRRRLSMPEYLHPISLRRLLGGQSWGSRYTGGNHYCTVECISPASLLHVA
jgi:hypothetical protein